MSRCSLDSSTQQHITLKTPRVHVVTYRRTSGTGPCTGSRHHRTRGRCWNNHGRHPILHRNKRKSNQVPARTESACLCDRQVRCVMQNVPSQVAHGAVHWEESPQAALQTLLGPTQVPAPLHTEHGVVHCELSPQEAPQMFDSPRHTPEPLFDRHQCQPKQSARTHRKGHHHTHNRTRKQGSHRRIDRCLKARRERPDSVRMDTPQKRNNHHHPHLRMRQGKCSCCRLAGKYCDPSGWVSKIGTRHHSWRHSCTGSRRCWHANSRGWSILPPTPCAHTHAPLSRMAPSVSATETTDIVRTITVVIARLGALESQQVAHIRHAALQEATWPTTTTPTVSKGLLGRRSLAWADTDSNSVTAAKQTTKREDSMMVFNRRE